MKNSKLKKLYDFRQIEVPAKLLEIPLQEKQIRQELAGVCERFIGIEEVADEVKAGDIITIILAAEQKDEEEILYVNVGKNFHGKDWEEKLLGLQPGAEVFLQRGGKTRKGKISQIKRRIYPPLSDLLIQRMGIENVHTVKDYQEFLENKLIEEKKQEKQEILTDYVEKETIKRTEFEDITKETEEFYTRGRKNFEKIAQQRHISYQDLIKTVTPKQLKTLEEQEKYIRSQQVYALKANLIGEYFAKNTKLILNQSTYEILKKEYLKQGIDPQTIEESFSYEEYISQSLRDCFRDQINLFFEDKFKVVRA